LCAALLCASTLGFSKTYGWVDLAPVHETKTTAKVSGIMLSHDTTFLANLKPYINKKGFLIDEKYYAVDGKKYFRTIITAPKGKKMPIPTNKKHQVVLYLGRGNASGEEMIYYEFGYKAPNVEVTHFAPRPPPGAPMLSANNKGYIDPYLKSRNELTQYASANIVYPATAIKHEITGTVIANFTVDLNGKIKDVKVINSISKDCDEQVINALRNFPGVIKGKYHDYLVAISFDLFGRTKDYTPTRHHIDKTIYKKPNFILGLGLTEYGPDNKPTASIPPPPPPVPQTGKPTPPKPKVDQVKFPQPVVKPGKSMPPKPIVDQVKFPPPVIVTDSEKHSLEKFYASLQKSIRYPAIDRENKVTGKVFVSFTVTTDNKIDLIKVLRGPSPTLEAEAVSALKRVGSAPGTQPGITYVIPVSFNLSNADGSYVANGSYMAETSGKTITNTLKMPNIQFELSEIVIIGYLQ
jgi:protein TonB